MIEVILKSQWWLQAVYGDFPGLQEETPPQPGYYATRLVPRGPLVPARIWIERDLDDETGELMADEEIHCVINGQAVKWFEHWPGLTRHVITEEKWKEMENERVSESVG